MNRGAWNKRKRGEERKSNPLVFFLYPQYCEGFEKFLVVTRIGKRGKLIRVGF
jgi:hypothetical protein